MTTLTTNEWALVTAALGVAAEQYRKDAATMRKFVSTLGSDRLAQGFEEQAANADRLRKRIESEEGV